MTDMLSVAFNEKADSLPETDFARFISLQFDAETSAGMVKLFERLELPLPAARTEYMSATEGCLLFLTPYGVVLRIEHADFDGTVHQVPDRINDNGHILQPIAAVKVGNALVEICPGCPKEDDGMQVDGLYNALREMGVDYWDWNFANTGRLPVRTPSFPEGVPIVIDRLAVRHLTDSVRAVSDAVKQAAKEAAAAQEALYGPLRGAFKAAWDTPAMMAEFWELCATYVDTGKLVAGWAVESQKDDIKPIRAYDCARNYSKRL